MKGFKISKNLTLPPEAVAWVIGFLAKRNAGKTYNAADLCEEMLKANIPVIVIDGMSVWWGLRVGKDGKGSGLPIVILGGEHADIKLDPTKIEKIVEALLQTNTSAVLDIGQLRKGEQMRVVTAFVEELYRLAFKYPAERHIFIEESDMFCLSDDTEILTSQGWKNYKQIQVNDAVLTLNRISNSLEYNKIERIIVKDYDDNLVHFKTRSGLNALMTPEHRVLMQTYYHGKNEPWSWNKQYELRDAITSPPSGFRIPAAAQFSGLSKMVFGTDFLRLLGWIITDGNWNDRTKRSIKITQSKPHGITEIERILLSLGMRFTKHTRIRRPNRNGPNGRTITGRLPCTEFYISTTSTKIIKEILGENLHEIPRCILDLPSTNLRHLYEGLMGGDGTSGYYLTRKSKQPRFRTNGFYCFSDALSNQFQELCVKIGVRGFKRETRILVSERFPYYYVNKSSMMLHPYKGKVWDITVKNGCFVARRNGAAFITGNCPQRPFKEEARCLGAFEDLVKRGGNRNLGCTLITQRSASLNKNVLTQADCLVIGRTTAPQDKAAIQAWVEKHSEKDKRELEEWYDSLSSLKKGEVWVWNADEEWNIFKKVQFRERETFHATRKFMLTKHAQQIKLMDATTFIEKFKDKFEPTPKPKPEPKIVEPRLVPEKATYTPPKIVQTPFGSRTSASHLHIPIEPPVTFKAGESKRLPVPIPTQRDIDAGMETVRVNQTLPNIQIQQFKPTLALTVEQLNEPTSPLGRVCVVLKNDAQAGGRLDAWTVKRISTHIHNHGWDDAGVEEAVAQLVRWEVLKKKGNYLRFFPPRIQITETQTQMEA